MVEPTRFPAHSFPLDPLRVVWSVLDRMAGDRNTLVLNLFARPHPETGEIRYWSPELNLLFPPVPAGSSLSGFPFLKAVATRSPSGWTIRGALPDAGATPPGVLLWEVSRSPEKVAGDTSPANKNPHPSVFPDDTRSPFLARPDNGGHFAEASGPLPPEIPVDARPDRCWLDIRWPSAPEEERENSPETGVSAPRRSGSVPFRLELSFAGGRSVVVGGVYEPSPRTLSLSVRTGDDGIRSNWKNLQKDLSRDLASVLSIRLSGSPGYSGEPE